MFRTASSRRSYQAALRDLSSADGAVRAAAAEDLAQHADERREEVVAQLLRALGDDDARVRAAAALGLADARAQQAVEALSAAVADDHETVRQMALAALGELGAEAALPAIEGALEEESAAVRFQAVMAFPRACTVRDRSVEVLLAATRDEDPLIRRIALRMAEELGGPEGEVVEEAFLRRAQQLLQDDDDAVRVAAAVILGRAGSDAGAQVLVGVAAREVITSEAEDEAAALELCGTLRLERAAAALERRGFERVLLLRNDPFAWQARVALAAMGHPRGEKWLLGELGAWTRERRGLAVAAAERARLAAARPLLEAMRGDPARADQDAVERALNALDDAQTHDDPR
jgi:HEAT repeat protein